MPDTLVYTRTNEPVTDGDGANGRRGKLECGSSCWYTVERADGYKWLRPMTYDCEMAFFTSGSGSQAAAIRVLGDYSKGRIYIHPANYPHQLSGCIAPGKSQMAGGVGASKAAMEEIFALARARKIALEEGIVAATLNFMDKIPAAVTASMQRDIMAGRPSELADQNGAVVRLGEQAGVPVPTHNFIYHSLLPLEMKARGEIFF